MFFPKESVAKKVFLPVHAKPCELNDGGWQTQPKVGLVRLRTMDFREILVGKGWLKVGSANMAWQRLHGKNCIATIAQSTGFR